MLWRTVGKACPLPPHGRGRTHASRLSVRRLRHVPYNEAHSSQDPSHQIHDRSPGAHNPAASPWRCSMFPLCANGSSEQIRFPLSHFPAFPLMLAPCKAAKPFTAAIAAPGHTAVQRDRALRRSCGGKVQCAKGSLPVHKACLPGAEQVFADGLTPQIRIVRTCNVGRGPNACKVKSSDALMPELAPQIPA